MRRAVLTSLTTATAVVLVTGCGGGSSGSEASGGVTTREDGVATVRMTLNPAVYGYLPIHVAVERGYFQDEQIDLQLSDLQGSSAALLPQLARGDLDIAPVVAAPGLFNAYAEGFDAKLMANINGPREGWGESGYLMVRQELWDGGGIDGPEDLRGLRLDGGPAGSPLNLVARQAIDVAGLSPGDLTFTENFVSTGDQLAALENGAVDVLAVSEVTASQLGAQGVAHKWLPASEVVAWAQDGFFAANAEFLEGNADVAGRFLRAYVRGAEDVTAAGPEWTPELLAIAAEATGTPEDVLQMTGGPQWVGSLGETDLDALDRVQQVWADAGLVAKPVDVEEMVDVSVLSGAK